MSVLPATMPRTPVRTGSLQLYTSYCRRMFDIDSLSRCVHALCENAQTIGIDSVSPVSATHCRMVGCLTSLQSLHLTDGIHKLFARATQHSAIMVLAMMMDMMTTAKK